MNRYESDEIKLFQNDNEEEKVHEIIEDLEYCTKAQLTMNIRGNVICKVAHIRLIAPRQVAIASIHILPNSISQTAVLMDMIAVDKQTDRLINSLIPNNFYKICKIKPYKDPYYFHKTTLAFDQLSTIQILDLPTKIINRFNINWLERKAEITSNYQKRNIHEAIIAGFVHRIPYRKNSQLHIMTIRNKTRQIIDVNLWHNQLPQIFASIKLNDIIILPKVNHAKIWNGRNSLNNNGPIYKENNLWCPDQNIDLSNVILIDLSSNFKNAKCIFFFCQ